MKSIINYFYNLNVENIRMIGEDYYFSYNNRNYIFQKIRDNYLDFQSILTLNKILLEHNKNFFQIVINRNNQIITIGNNKKYILMINNFNVDREINLRDILNTNIIVNKYNKNLINLNKSNWVKLWQEKIDYFEMFINYNVNSYNELSKFSNYFIGVGETAISYIKDSVKEEQLNNYDNLVVSHKRVDGSLTQLYNPLNLIIDHPVRDVAEYLKSIFFKNKNIDVSRILNSINISRYGARLLMARMIFPSYFFDAFEKYMDKESNEEDIFHLMNFVSDYELYLLKIYSELKIKYDIPEINWLKKVDYSSTLTTPNTSGISLINIDSIPSLSVTSIMLQ